uniref:hypothetical protein n=1 Tax=Actinokineospora sp. CA-119265 TaxID=3239890 RepID=UPI003F497A45
MSSDDTDSAERAEGTEHEVREEYTWLIEVSDDGRDWSSAAHASGEHAAGGMERAVSAERLARDVLERRLATLRDEFDFEWEELWFRATVWEHRLACDWAGPHHAPHPPEQAGVAPGNYGAYLQTVRAEPDAVEVRVPRQVRTAAHLLHARAASNSPARAGS